MKLHLIQASRSKRLKNHPLELQRLSWAWAWVVLTSRLVGDKITVLCSAFSPSTLRTIARFATPSHCIALLPYSSSPPPLPLLPPLSLSLLLLYFLLSPITSSFSKIFRPPHSISAHDGTRTRRQSLSIISKLHLYPVSTSLPHPQEAETINTVCHPIPSHPSQFWRIELRYALVMIAILG
jgi:hypothetical protein